MKISRRKAILILAGLSLTPSALAYPQDYLWGTWIVRCPKGHDDKVEDGTAQHKCEKCGLQVFKDGKVTAVCPKGHPNVIELKGRTESATCKVADCKSECCRKKMSGE
jgi:hypothetical protein